VATSPPTIYVGTLDSQEGLRLLDSESKALYANGYLLFTRAGTLLAQPFDAAHLKITGEAFPVAEDVGVNTYNTRAAFSASSTGVLTYRTATTRQTQLIWFGRDGKQIEALGDQAEYEEPELSPDGKRVAVELRDPATRDDDVWIYDVARGVRARLTFNPGGAIGPRWSPNGDSIIFSSKPEFSSNPSVHSKLIATPSSGAGTEQVLLEGNEGEYPDSWSEDGRFILYELNDPKTSWDLWVLPWADHRPRPFMQTNLRQEAGRFSPDGRWIAYRSTESGRSEVYVVPFPGAGGKWQISSAGGTYPRWRRDGREVFFLAPDNTLMAVSVSGEGPAFEIGPVLSLFKTRLRNRGRLPYDVSADGQRFLVNAVPEPTGQVPMTVIVNWTAALKK
jgi:dipeptidyl aminopeptidase/acylaminoacyl peptidase